MATDQQPGGHVHIVSTFYMVINEFRFIYYVMVLSKTKWVLDGSPLGVPSVAPMHRPV